MSCFALCIVCIMSAVGDIIHVIKLKQTFTIYFIALKPIPTDPTCVIVNLMLSQARIPYA